MSYINEERPNVKAMMDLFVAINELCKYYTLDQAIDVLDIYLKTGNSKNISAFGEVREYVENSNILETFQPIYDEGYNHLHDYLDGIIPKKEKTK